MEYQLVLATDLDGTFLEGDAETKRFFYNKLLELRNEVLLIYATGRPVETVKSFCELGFLPHPHFVLGDHGTHIADGATFAPVMPLQEAIAATWNHGNQTIRDLLRGEKGLRLQPIDPPYRVAYYYDPDQLESGTLEKIAKAGFDGLMSCDAYLDILPKGVNKGSSLLKLLEHLNVRCDLAITTGDSLNDLPLFQTGLKSIAVGNSEPKLVDITKNLDNVYHSRFPGLLGIMDGLKFYDRFQLFSPQEALLPSL